MALESLVKTADARLYPSLRDPNYLVLRARRLIFASQLQDLGNSLVVLDVGGRYQPYRPLIAAKVSRYLALDIKKTELVTVLGSGEQIPFQDGTFDLVIATCVFDYFPNPHPAAQEIFRVLKPGGRVFASFGALVPRFEEDECWRYLPFGLRSLFAPFSAVSITPEVSSLGGFCRLVNLALHDFLKLRVLKSAYRFTICPVVNVLGMCLEKAHLTDNDKWTGNYSVLATK